MRAGKGHLVGRLGAAERLVPSAPPVKSQFGQNGCAEGLVGPRGFALQRRGGVRQRVLSQMSACPLPWRAGASGASVGPPAPGRHPTLSLGTVQVMQGSNSSPVRQASCCGQVSPASHRNLCVSSKRYKDHVGKKMPEAGPDPLNYTPRCLWVNGIGGAQTHLTQHRLADTHCRAGCAGVSTAPGEHRTVQSWAHSRRVCLARSPLAGH